MIEKYEKLLNDESIRHFKIVSTVLFIISAVLFWLIGGWKLVLAIWVFAWANNLQEGTKDLEAAKKMREKLEEVSKK